MKRVNEVVNYIYTVESTVDRYKGYSGVATQDIANALHLRRNNVSSLLNDLVYRHIIFKTKSRPVCYVSQKLIQRLDLENYIEDESVIRLDHPELNEANSLSFNSLIGVKGSLLKSIETARAAIAYPPHGLHSIIFGESGVGKSLFAHCMHDFYQTHTEKRVPFVHFNCADYHQNPQLLLSHLFGHVKGAYSGADQEREGLVAKANGGILFLDEIHRLPPDGQEMLFSLIDNKTYSKLGSEKLIQCQVLLISATTVSPEKALLKTFLRRIPVTITLPRLNEKSFDELFELIRYLFAKQAQHIQKDIIVKREVINNLIKYLPSGAIGQLSSDIKQTCANALLLDKNTSDFLTISNENIPVSISKQKFTETSIQDIYLSSTGIDPKLTDIKVIDKLEAIGACASDQQRKILIAEYYTYLHSMYSLSNQDMRQINGYVDTNIIDLCRKLNALAREINPSDIRYNLISILSMHLHMLSFSNKELGEKASKIRSDSPIEHRIHTLCSEHQLFLPAHHVQLLLELINEGSRSTIKSRIGVIIVCHGIGVASNIAKVCNTLFDTTFMQAIDIPLEHSIKDHFDEIKSKICSIDQGKGVAILADMGSTTSIAQSINDMTGIKTVCFSNMSTPLALEVLRRTLYEDDSIEELRAHFEKEQGPCVTVKSDAILSICTTGIGSSEFITQKLQNIIILSERTDVKVVTLGLSDLQQGSVTFKSILENSNILFAVGTVAPELDVPFYSISELFSDHGESTFTQMLKNQTIEQSIYDDCFDILSDYIMYLNPKQVIRHVKSYIDSNDYISMVSDDIKLKLVLHISGMIERLTHNSADNPISVPAGDFSLEQTRQNIELIELAYKIEISDIELSYITQIAFHS